MAPGANGLGVPYVHNLANPHYTAQRLDNVIVPGTLNQIRPGAAFEPLNLLTNVLFNPPYPLTGDSPDLGLVFLTVSPTLPSSNLRSPYSMHYSTSVERRFGNFSVTAAYVGSIARKLLMVTTPGGGANDSDVFDLGLAQQPDISPAFPFFQGGAGRYFTPEDYAARGFAKSFMINPTIYESAGNSVYNSLQLNIRKQFSRGGQFGSAFTFSRSIDNASDFFDNAGAFALPQDSRVRSERGLSNFDSRIRLASFFSVDVGTLTRNAPALRGWEISGIFVAQSGQPFTVNSAIDVNRDGNLTDRLDTTDPTLLAVRAPRRDSRAVLNLLATETSALLATCHEYQCIPRSGRVGRNTFLSEGFSGLDLALTKTYPLPRDRSISMRLEAFNVLNQTAFGIPVRILEMPSFGSAVSTRSPARILQLSLRIRL